MKALDLDEEKAALASLADREEAIGAWENWADQPEPMQLFLKRV